MSGPALLAEFFSAGVSLLWRFLSHPVTVGSFIIFVVAVALCWVLYRLQLLFPKYNDEFEALSILSFAIGLILFFVFVIWASVQSPPVDSAWIEFWGL